MDSPAELKYFKNRRYSEKIVDIHHAEVFDTLLITLDLLKMLKERSTVLRRLSTDNRRAKLIYLK